MNIISPDIVSVDVSVDTDKHVDNCLDLRFTIYNNDEELHVKQTYIVIYGQAIKTFAIENCIISSIKHGNNIILIKFDLYKVASKLNITKIQFSFVTQLGRIDSNIITINQQV